MADEGSAKRWGIGLAAAGLAVVVGYRVLGRDDGASGRGAAADGVAAAVDSAAQSPLGPAPGASGAGGSEPGAPGPGAAGLSAPIAAAHVAGGEVVVAALDVSARGIRVQRIGADDRIVADRVVLDDVAWSTDADLKLAAHAEVVAVTWRGLRGGKLVRELVVVGADLAAKEPPVEVAAASCATRDALWFSDGARATSRPFRGAPHAVELPKDRDSSLLCGPGRAFAVLDEDDGTSILPLAAAGPSDAAASKVVTLLRERDFGDDEQRELAEYTVGDDVGVVRLGGSGAVTIREIAAGVLGPLRRLKATIPKDDDVVAVDASPKVLAIVYSEDVSAACPAGPGGPGDGAVATKVMVLRVDRESFEESTAELAPGRCGYEIGPFFTGALGGALSVAWAERSGGAGRARAPIAGLAHAVVARAGAPSLARVEQRADALVDAGCDGARCYAAALVRRDEADALSPGFVRILRYE
ncbi:MAG: hypothetical protein KF850_12630 [Labilithrix sp.]|nr:hypothetical protein [Labilithrix sp.]